jgi:hypothetical protein
MNPNNPNSDSELSAAQNAAHSLGIDLLVLHASSEKEIETAFTSIGGFLTFKNTAHINAD